MPLYISMLRGINLGSHNKIKMPDLKELYAALKFENIATYIQSGNVVFESGKKDIAALEKLIEKKIRDQYGYEVPVIIRTAKDLQDTLDRNPFAKEKNAEDARMYFTFLDAEPDKEKAEAILKYNYEPDRFVLSGREVFIYCPGGYGNSKLNNNFFENKLKVKGTTRNLNTVNQLISMANSQ